MQLSLAERVLASCLRPFARVEPLEAFVATAIALAALLLLTAYYPLKTVRAQRSAP
jgi:hypothetical protein